MIDSAPEPHPDGLTLHGLFVRNVTASPARIALTESPGRRGGPAVLTYSEAERAVANLASTLRAFGLPEATRIALLLPSGIEFAISFLAALRAGLVPVPLPVLWRHADLSRAIALARAQALVTTGNFALENLPQMAADAARANFDLGFPCAFEPAGIEGVIPLVLETGGDPVGIQNGGPSSSMETVVTVAARSEGIALAERTPSQWLAASVAVALSAGIQPGDSFVCAKGLHSLAGLATALVPWLMAGGTLHLGDPLAHRLPIRPDERIHVAATARLIPALCATLRVPIRSALALHCDGAAGEADLGNVPAERIVDVHAIGENAVIAAQRLTRTQPQPVPLGALRARKDAGESPVVLETAVASDTSILLRGPMLPLAADGRAGWINSGFTAGSVSPSSFLINPPEAIIAIGGLSYGIADLERRIVEAVADARVAMVADPALGSRVVIWSADPAIARQALLDAGLPRIIASAVLKSEGRRATG
jgi:hypothetical protein